MTAIDFYYYSASPPCRAVMLVAKSIGLEMNMKHLDLMIGETNTPEFLKINPQHAVPAIVDDGFVLSESRAIICYLVDQYAKDDSLYPKDPKKRAVVNQRLYFDMGTLYGRFLTFYYPVIFLQKPRSEELLKKLEEALGYLDTFLEGQSWVAGEDITIADHAISVTVCSMEAFGVNISKFPNVFIWYTKAKSVIPGFEEINRDGVIAFGSV